MSIPDCGELLHVFDLKGSTFKRYTKKKGQTNNTVLKDMNFLEITNDKSHSFNLSFTSKDRNNILKVIKQDSKFLSKNNYIDYSLLIGI